MIIVDGTGPEGNQEYDREMHNSFCRQLGDAVPGAVYLRGPTWKGFETGAIINQATLFALSHMDQGKPLILVGYSRGGCAVINVAKNLNLSRRRVNAMFLFDAVDMQGSTMGVAQVIPDNVDSVAHARSARDIMFWMRNPVKSRFYFYNTGRRLQGSGKYHEMSFVGSHGAVGGVPWPEAEVRGDADCARSVASWMNPHLQSAGVTARLRRH